MSRVRYRLLRHVKRFCARIQLSLTNNGKSSPRLLTIRAATFPEGDSMKRDQRTLSSVRETSPFDKPPRVLVVADDETAGQAVALAEALEAAGADAEVRFGTAKNDHSNPDAVIVAQKRGYSVTRHHPILESVSLAAR
jgi:hypothetical protein